MSRELADFLLARIAEDEAVAKATSGQPWSATVPGMVHADGGFRIKSRYVASVEHVEDRAHIARHDPARVLAECDAKRRIVEEFDRLGSLEAAGIADGGATVMAIMDGLEIAIRALALPYADHPDYESTWKP